MQRLVAEVDAVSDAMLAGLLAKLGGPIQLPECLRVVGCLRRLAPFPEAELRTRRVPSSLLGSLSRMGAAVMRWSLLSMLASLLVA